jgi:predicted transcriptional regulator of viral defense system
MVDARTEESRLARLYNIAENQGGYFTAAQAQSAGYDYSLLSYHVGTGRFLRVHRGVYRLALYPASSIEDLYAAQLQAGPSAVISHDTALALYELSDVLPARIHITVSSKASRRHAHLQLHTNHLDSNDVTRWLGLRVTTVSRTIADVAVAGLADELVIQALIQALERGLVTRDALTAYMVQRGTRARRLVYDALRESAP